MFMGKLGFGLMRLPQSDPEDSAKVDMNELKQMVDAFIQRGFNYFDTAYMYHGGFSETAIASTLTRRYPRDRFLLADKLPMVSVETKDDRQRIFDEQLRRCGVDYFDVYLLHNLGEETYAKAKDLDAFGFLLDKKEEGRAKRIGFSYHYNADLLDVILTDHPEVDFVQLQVNYLDWDDDGIQSRRCCEVAKKHGKPVIVMEPVKGGTLADIPEDAAALLRGHAPGRSPASWALRYAADIDGVAIVLSGMSNMEQLLENMGVMQNVQPLTETERAAVASVVKIISGSVAIPCTACQYCVDTCPSNIPIPKYFALYNNRKQSAPAPFYIQQVYYDSYADSFGRASSCVACGECERHCPQHLDVAGYMKDVAELFESE